MLSPASVGVPTAVGRRTFDEPEAPLAWRWLRPPVRLLLERSFGLAIEGLEHLPAGGGWILAANHHNYLDGVVLGAAVPMPVAFLVMPRVWRATPLHPALHRAIGSIELEVDGPDPGAFRQARAALDAGRVVGIFPEGPFSTRGRLEAGQAGVGLLALATGARVVPAAVRGTYEALVGRRGYLPRRRPLAVRFGASRTFTPLPDEPRRVARARVTAAIMADIGELLA